MAKKIAWHTDIVVDGMGMNVKVTKPRNGSCAVLSLKPDVPGAKSSKAKARFIKKVEAQAGGCSTASLKKAVGRAVKETRSRWNQWHRETYS